MILLSKCKFRILTEKKEPFNVMKVNISTNFGNVEKKESLFLLIE